MLAQTLLVLAAAPVPQHSVASGGSAADRGPESAARRPAALTIAPDGATAWVAQQRDGRVDVIDLASGLVRRHLAAHPAPRTFRQTPVDVALDPEGRHVFVTNASARTVAVFDAATDALAARLDGPRGNQRVAFDFGGAVRRIYVTNDREDAVLVWEEAPLGTFTRVADLALDGLDPRPLAVLPGGHLLVGLRGTHEVLELDPLAPGGNPVARKPLGSLPLDVVPAGSAYLVPTFTPTLAGPDDGRPEVLRVDRASQATLARFFPGQGTDYVDLDLRGGFVAVACAGSGSVLVADASSGALLERVALAGPGAPLAVPVALALAPAPGGAAIERLYVVNTFRETLRPVDLTGGPPFRLLPEIALAATGKPRVPLRDLSEVDDGEWFFRSGAFFRGTVAAPNPASCATCHPDAGADGLVERPTLRQVPPLFRSHETEPLGWQGQIPLLNVNQIRGTFNTHGIVAGAPPSGAAEHVLAFLTRGTPPPPSPYLLDDGGLAPGAILGKALFEGAAGCAACHVAPLFLPAPPDPLTLAAGVGTGLAPVNVPSLRGAWNTAPYLHDGSAATLRDVLTSNVANQHGSTSALSAVELDLLTLYLRSL